MLHWVRHFDPRRWLGWVADFCYPGRCLQCEADGPGARPLCPKCMAPLEELAAAARCGSCAMPLAEEGAPCPYCLGKGLYPFEQVLSLGVFGPPLRQLIHRFKYGRQWPLGEYLAEMLARQRAVRASLAETDCIVPVPLHWRRRLGRGFDQAQVIASRLRAHSGLPVVRPAIRVRPTETQTRLSATARHENLKNAFALVRPQAVEGRRLLLVDDVKTSGATLQSLARVLLAAKPASLSAVVLAVADPRHRDFEAI